MIKKFILSTVGVGMGLIFFATAAHALVIHGAGASFPNPLYTKWFSEYQKKNADVQINYQSIGSGGGIRQFSEGTIYFGATDAPMNAEQLKAAKSPVVHIPTILGAVVVTYNLPGLTQTVKLSSELVADIFLGKVTKWNDARIKKINDGLALPDMPIIVAHRSDGSGTTAIFTEFLSKTSPEWKAKVGSGTALSWPAGLGGKGNEGVAGLVTQSPGTIGYVEWLYAKANNLPAASLANRTGKFVEPSLESIQTAADETLKQMRTDKTKAEDLKNFRISLTDAPGATSYPIAGLTYLLLWDKKDSDPRAAAFQKFLLWALDEGQKMGPELHYAPLPQSLRKAASDRVKSLSATPAKS